MGNIHSMWLNENSKLQDYLHIWSSVCVCANEMSKNVNSILIRSRIMGDISWYLKNNNFYNEHVLLL